MALAGPPRSHENEPPLRLFHTSADLFNSGQEFSEVAPSSQCHHAREDAGVIGCESSHQPLARMCTTGPEGRILEHARLVEQVRCTHVRKANHKPQVQGRNHRAQAPLSNRPHAPCNADGWICSGANVAKLLKPQRPARARLRGWIWRRSLGAFIFHSWCVPRTAGSLLTRIVRSIEEGRGSRGGVECSREKHGRRDAEHVQTIQKTTRKQTPWR